MENVISFLIILLVLSLLTNLYYVNGSVSERRKNKKEKSLTARIVKKFLASQSSKTTNSKADQSIPNLYPSVIKFRSAYLMIESKAVDRGIDSKDYWRVINEKIKLLFDILIKYESNPTLKSIEKKVKSVKSLIAASKDITDKDILTACLDRFYNACVDNSHAATLNRYDKKLNRLLIRFSDKNLSVVADITDAHERFSTASKRAIAKHSVAGHILDMPDVSTRHSPHLVGALGNTDNREIESLISDYKNRGEKLKESLSMFDRNFSESHDAIARATLGSNAESISTKNSQQSALDLLNISESLQEKSEKEVANLKRVVRDQRETIYSLESELNKMDKAPSDSINSDSNNTAREHYEFELRTIQGNLKDAESCIGVLELELNELQAQIKLSRDVFQKDNSIITEQDQQVLEKIVKELEDSAKKSSVELEFLRVFHEYSLEATKLSSIEDLAMHAFVSLADLGYDSHFIIYGADREFVVSSSGAIPEKMKTILKNLSLNEAGQNSDNKRLFTRQANLSCVLVKADGEPIPDGMSAQLLTLVQHADHIIKRILAESKNRQVLRSLDHQSNSIKMKSHELDRQLMGVFDTIAKSANVTSKRIQDLARVSGMNASQIARLRTYEQDLVDEITDSKSINLKVKKVLFEILNDIEKMYE